MMPERSGAEKWSSQDRSSHRAGRETEKRSSHRPDRQGALGGVEERINNQIIDRSAAGRGAVAGGGLASKPFWAESVNIEVGGARRSIQRPPARPPPFAQGPGLVGGYTRPDASRRAWATGQRRGRAMRSPHWPRRCSVALAPPSHGKTSERRRRVFTVRPPSRAGLSLSVEGPPALRMLSRCAFPRNWWG